ncbi:MAG: hypothetical protein ABJA64_02960, partial [Candidatus Saccharibacteria bacterium]
MRGRDVVMTSMTTKVLTERAASLRGKKIEVSEAGYQAEGLVEKVKVTDGNFYIYYITGSELETHHIGGAWGWASIGEFTDPSSLR